MGPTSRHLALACATCLLLGCVKQTNFRDPHQRITADSADTLKQWEVKPEVGLAGSGSGDLGVYLGAEVGLTDSTHVGVNLAHLAVGWFSGGIKQNIFDEERWGLAGAVGFGWINFNWLWVLPGAVQAELASFDVFIIPMTLVGTFRATDWLDLSLGASYTHSEIKGELDVDSKDLVADGAVGIREVAMAPTVRAYLWQRLALTVSATLPLWSAAPVAGSGEAMIKPGVIVGSQTSNWQQVDFGRLWKIRAAVEWPITEHAHVSIGVLHGLLARDVLSVPLLPTVNFYWRIW